VNVTENSVDKDLHWVSWWPWVRAHRGRGGSVSICHCIGAKWGGSLSHGQAIETPCD